jgi:prepilin-type N-terminal cleavage/methylation domain-containing protein/prepilin-type processing-associated H-X9-DG protein
MRYARVQPHAPAPAQAARPRAGFTLIELLVVIAIIGVLIALLLPAVQSARVAARRVQCTNNLSQIGLAMHSYIASHEVLPPGSVDATSPVLSLPKGYHHNWISQILPFLEQRGVYNALNFGLGVYEGANSTARGTTMRTLLCPSDGWSGRAAGTDPASSYAGCHHDAEAPIATDNHGLLFLNSAVVLEEILDGSSNTILVGEKVLEADLGWASGTRATLRNTGTPINAAKRPRLGGPPATAAPPTAPNFVGGYSSNHPGGVNVVLGDGSVKFLKDSIDAVVLGRLGNRGDGEVVDGDSY